MSDDHNDPLGSASFMQQLDKESRSTAPSPCCGAGVICYSSCLPRLTRLATSEWDWTDSKQPTADRGKNSFWKEITTMRKATRGIRTTVSGEPLCSQINVFLPGLWDQSTVSGFNRRRKISLCSEKQSKGYKWLQDLPTFVLFRWLLHFPLTVNRSKHGIQVGSEIHYDRLLNQDQD